ncbi:hypothetical protein [Dactylosporangium sp. NPDC000521]|uniref:hypothetical protein n=1 Tax=Dactylosporangium sp. NPDC000521 TaxID=3363975 RepID=UPI0036AFB9DB
MREKVILIGVLVLVCGGVMFWRHNPFSDEAPAWAEPGCYVESWSGLRVELDSAGPGDSLRAAPCDNAHGFEIIAFFDPDDAEASCRKRASEFLDGPLAESRVGYGIVHASDEDVASLGCALYETMDSRGTPTTTTGSLRHGMRGPGRPAAVTCVGEENNGKHLSWKRCDDGHSGEFTGATADGGQPEVSCLGVVASFLGLPESATSARDDLTVLWLESHDPGHLLCFVGREDGEDTLRGSLRGLGPAPLPTGN